LQTHARRRRVDRMPQWNDQGADRGTMVALQQQTEQAAQYAQGSYYGVSSVLGSMSSLQSQMTTLQSALTPPTLQYYAANLDGAALESLVATTPVGSHLEVWGWCSSTTSASSTYVQLRSGNTANDASSVPLKDLQNYVYDTAKKRPIGPSCSINIPPGTRALWRSRDGEGLIVKKDDASHPHDFELWFRTVPN